MAPLRAGMGPEQSWWGNESWVVVGHPAEIAGRSWHRRVVAEVVVAVVAIRIEPAVPGFGGFLGVVVAAVVVAATVAGFAAAAVAAG